MSSLSFNIGVYCVQTLRVCTATASAPARLLKAVFDVGRIPPLFGSVRRSAVLLLHLVVVVDSTFGAAVEVMARHAGVAQADFLLAVVAFAHVDFVGAVVRKEAMDSEGAPEEHSFL